MKSFRSLVVLKRPQSELWTIMRDHLVDFSDRIADIEEVREIGRTVDDEGVVHVINEWRVCQQMPPMLRALVKTDELSWIDRNRWDARTHTCRWTIEPKFLTEYISCSGLTVFASAMGGQGTRVTFEGELALQQGMLGGAQSGLEQLLSGFVESTVTTVVPRNLRSVAEAAAAFEVPQ